MQSHFFASAESALQKRTDVLFTDYLKKHVLPGLTGQCSSTKTTDKNCVVNIGSGSSSSRLYRAWADARLENKMAEDYGIEFARNTDRRFSLKVRGQPDTKFEESFLSDTQGFENIASTNEARQKIKGAMDEALQGETKLKRVFYRFKVGVC